jgi:hypothetical protein
MEAVLQTIVRSLGSVLSLLLAGCLDGDLRLNQIQVLGTHNSYHLQPRPELLGAIAGFDAQLAATLEYSALPLGEQLDRGVRQMEFDVLADPEGGRYARRAGLIAVGEDPDAGLPELAAPGLKVLHIPDIDFETHCASFRACLEPLANWSRAHPAHVPLMLMIEAKQDAIPDPLGLGFVTPLEFDAAELDGIDREIRSVFAEDELITPDLVRGTHDTLEAAVTGSGWPLLARVRGRLMFTFLNGDAARERYMAGHPSLRGRVMFTTTPTGQPEAAFFNINDARIDGGEITARVAAGYLVRTRADIDTFEARSGDPGLREAAFASGAQFVSTDYLVPDPDFGTGYVVALPGGAVARCNPINAPADCGALQRRFGW